MEKILKFYQKFDSFLMDTDKLEEGRRMMIKMPLHSPDVVSTDGESPE